MHARRILGYSYVFAFYMFGQVMFAEEVSLSQNAINQNLFEDQQQQLEHVVSSTSFQLLQSLKCLPAALASASVGRSCLPGKGLGRNTGATSLHTRESVSKGKGRCSNGVPYA